MLAVPVHCATQVKNVKSINAESLENVFFFFFSKLKLIGICSVGNRKVVCSAWHYIFCLAMAAILGKTK